MIVVILNASTILMSIKLCLREVEGVPSSDEIPESPEPDESLERDLVTMEDELFAICDGGFDDDIMMLEVYSCSFLWWLRFSWLPTKDLSFSEPPEKSAEVDSRPESEPEAPEKLGEANT